MARHHDKQASDKAAHGLGDTARRHAEENFAERFGTGRRTQNTPEDFGTAHDPEPFDHGYRSRPYYGERYGAEESRGPERGGNRDETSSEQAMARGFRGRGPKNYMRSDERIQEDLSERLWDSDEVDASDVTVEVKDGVVTLSGTVEQRRIKHRIEDIADACGGVKDIRNEIRVQRRDG